MPTQLVVFDLDETITRHDTLLPYAMGFVTRRKPWRLPSSGNRGAVNC